MCSRYGSWVRAPWWWPSSQAYPSRVQSLATEIQYAKSTIISVFNSILHAYRCGVKFAFESFWENTKKLAIFIGGYRRSRKILHRQT